MLADRLLLTEPLDGGAEIAVSTAWRDLHGAMIASLQRGGLEAVAKLAHEASGAPITIVVPGVVAVIEPASATTERECAMLTRRVREIIHRPGPVEFGGFTSPVPIRHNERSVGVVALWHDSVDSELNQLVNPDARAGAAPSTRLVLEVTAAAVLTALVIEDARMETEHRLRGSFLEQLRAGDWLNGAEISRRAARLGCDVSGGAVLLCVEVDGTRPRLVALGVTDDHPGAFAHAIAPVDGGPTQVWAILPALPDGGEGVVEATLVAAKRLAARLRQYGPVGLSRFHADPAEFARGLDEAELMLDVMRKAAVPPGSEIVEGTYKLLFRLLASHPDELSSYHATTIAPLVAHDEQYRTDLVRTLEVYLDTNCNMNVTADTIFAHRHTVAHRLERIHELTGLDPTIHEDREQLGLGLKIHRLTA